MTAFSGPDRDQLRQLLADAVPRGVRVVEGYRTHFREPTPDEVADALLPVVEAHTRAARADELEQAATELHHDVTPTDPMSLRCIDAAYATAAVLLRDRAEALRTHEGDTDGQ